MKKHQVAAAEKKKDNNMEKPLTTPLMTPPPTLERKTSIDAEPKTLFQEEMKVAREAALKIINSHSKEDALKIFLAGLVPVGTSSKQVKHDVVVSDCDDDDE
ncbi:hypothetical protein AAZX31_04G222300 [Glycine max]|uniref:Uncharacterized protein n=2 Tax=Glycine subgen. Soja TaxID=1462606 RepID=K7KM33_SOYBN|nr:uncharacterized protein LOC100787035 [Glycine max]XP_028227105.1 uncharacterized protein LOC114408244 [Glycine soja]KAG5036174.1 hypothetical protein JHK87_011084 [Glycine soja]KAG5050417.1 hypothetical protein JHK85_011520 [Glycine max]KAG5067471.1 hypothetical protein JHK86_011202 [Glycine max]KAH1112986.1 hypothetical protein GYH30_010948 [Glycine max]KAH1112987.1 hypothetical protein GYH30_010948 [Glycine max]|eukprot:XP_014630458.1 uncharacterized protein LOC100787035 [Glycine max]